MIWLLCLLQQSVLGQDDTMPLGAGLVVIDASCNMTLSVCVSPPCRFFCPKGCPEISGVRNFNPDTRPCREGQRYFSSQLAVDVFVSNNGSFSLAQSNHLTPIARRNSLSYCVGDMSMTNDAPVCVVSCALPDYECPPKYKQRCACPRDKPILKDLDKGLCVSNILECPPYSSYILPENGLKEFKFVKQPEDMVKKKGDRIRLFCSVGGSTDYQYFWYWSKILIMGSHSIVCSKDSYLQQTGTPYLDINSLQPSHAGFYHCVVRTGNSVSPEDARYTLVSNTGYLQVLYFEPPPVPDTVTVLRQENALRTVLPCELPDSQPPVQATWWKDDVQVDDKRMFVVPVSKRDEDLTRGSLLIMMVQSADAGFYECRTKYDGVSYIVGKVKLDVNGYIGQPQKEPQMLVEVSGRARAGGTATFFCAAVGNPAPDITWEYENGNTIRATDTIQLTDHNRQLAIRNVQPSSDRAKAFACTARSSKGARTSLLYLSILPSTYRINFVVTPRSHVLKPNVYTPFSLQCAITVDPTVESPVMYWLKNGKTLNMQPPSRVNTTTSERNYDGTTVRNSTLIFMTPNESDMGVYQCIVENKGQMRQATAYVTVDRSEPLREQFFPKVYYVSTTAVKVGEAATRCKSWHPRGTLVTINSKNESDAVFRLLVEYGLTRSWIGLSSEATWRQGVWTWQSQSTPPNFSYWYSDNPDNRQGNESYAIMDVTKAGHWLDVRPDEAYPFVCARYTANCPSIAKFFNNSAIPVSAQSESESTTYETGTVLTVACVDSERDLKSVVECLPSGEFRPSSLACPVVGSPATAPHPTFALLFGLFLLLR